MGRRRFRNTPTGHVFLLVVGSILFHRSQMSTRATITVADQNDSFDLYQHHDGYPDGPHGLVRYISMARRLAWDLPRFEAADFAAAIIAVLKDHGGATYLTKDADVHSDRSFYYRVERVREDSTASVQLTISRPSFERGKNEVEVFTDRIQDAAAKFSAVPDTTNQPREWQMLGEIESALYRAEEEVHQWVEGTPDPDTQATLDDLDNAGRESCLLRHHLEQNDPWRTLGQIEKRLNHLQDAGEPCQPTALPTVDVKLALEAHRRFQRNE